MKAATRLHLRIQSYRMKRYFGCDALPVPWFVSRRVYDIVEREIGEHQSNCGRVVLYGSRGGLLVGMQEVFPRS